RVNLTYINSEKLTAKNLKDKLSGVDGILVPGGFGERGVDGKLLAIQYARENNVPFFGICYGMQLAAVEFARNVCGVKDATSKEFAKEGKKQRNFVIHLMEDQKGVADKGGTMRLGAYPCHLSKGSVVKKAYKKSVIQERHRHRFEFNNKFKAIFEKNGAVFSGICEERDLVEIIEIPDHSFFVGVQFHPEFKSKPLQPHPLFTHFVKSSLENRELNNKETSTRKTKSRRSQSLETLSV
ncbi:MAG: gamma-glutamyl-gamma-aminobutyrate hydrolase family protein, partial [Bdellovibrionales bacterium]|nr:gamma-glutamyl-gamma-aminobutyrate hydrolase family protein [Bdellovibrionales bacterium]